VPPRKSRLIRNGLEKDWFESEEKLRPAGGVRFLYVGRLAPEKDLPALLKAFSRIAIDYPDARLRLVGSGPLLSELAKQADQEGVGDKIQFAGILSREEAREAMRESDVFVLPSRFESMSYTLLEAMACGLACIATDVGGNGELLASGKAGILVSARSALALESAMRSVAASQPLRDRLGRAAREHSRQYAVETMIASTRELYLSLLATHGLPRD
jgi:glycosyltransferase involved in cell wall biosynthesis